MLFKTETAARIRMMTLTGPDQCNGAGPEAAPWFLLCGSAKEAVGAPLY